MATGKQKVKVVADAGSLVTQAADMLVTRGQERDSESGERSMARTVKAFNALTGQDLSEKEGWLFMVVLKMARATSENSSTENPDDYVDGAAYVGLMGESVLK